MAGPIWISVERHLWMTYLLHTSRVGPIDPLAIVATLGTLDPTITASLWLWHAAENLELGIRYIGRSLLLLLTVYTFHRLRYLSRTGLDAAV